MRNWILGFGATALVATTCMAQRGERLSKECREEITTLCGNDRAAMRECLKEKRNQLSQGCAAELAKRFEGRGKDGAKDRDLKKRAADGTEYSYGNDPLQRLDFHKAAGMKAKAPLVVFVHGGGWKRGDKRNATGSEKAGHYTGLGYHFASINYRLVPATTVEQQAADVAAAIAWLVKDAKRLGIDADRIVLMGHSAGAHLSALVGTDPQYLRGAGLDLNLLDGVIPIDGAAYDVPSQMKDGGRMMQDTYVQAFGTDPARQKALSPFHHAAGPNAPAFLILHVEREDGKRQSEALAAALQKAGTKVEINAFAGKGLKGHAEINRKLGDPAYPATPVVDRWLQERFR